MRALLSVYDKTGVTELAARLHDLGVDLVSSGGTARVIAEAGIPVTDLADFTGYPAMLGHRVVTLHPKVHGGILADRDDPEHLADMATHEIDAIDIVVSNLYPFGGDPADFDHATGTASPVDLIDIGGPAMVRAAAKTHDHVTVLVDPSDYDAVLAEIDADGGTSLTTRRRLARKEFSMTAAYDARIVAWLDAESMHAGQSDGSAGGGGDDTTSTLPPTLHLSLERAQDLRYGENPHQSGARYRVQGVPSWWDDVEQHGGTGLSYLNLFDADAAWRLCHGLGEGPAVAIIKHANPCGAALGASLAEAYTHAFACDPRSAFGGIVALNREVDLATVEAIVGAAQADLIIAPGYADGVDDRIRAKRKNTRVLTAPLPIVPDLAVRQLSDGFLVQERHRLAASRPDWRVVTDRQPTDAEMADAELAWRVCAATTSNAIVLTKDGVAWGIGAGQQNRVESGQIAAQKADGRAVGGAAASDAFYPFRDGVDAAADAGVAVIVQPGGSMNDDKTIAAANERGVAMIFTGERQFLH